MKFNTLVELVYPLKSQEILVENKFTKFLAGLGLSLSTLIANDLYASSHSTHKNKFNNIKVNKEESKKDNKVLDYIKFITRVLFAEVGGSGVNKKVSNIERKLVASAINNRINHPAFPNMKTGKLAKNAFEVVIQPSQFSSINDKSNSLWRKSDNVENLNKEESENWNKLLEYAIQMQNNIFKPENSKIVAYHDKSIKKPKNWENNRYWKYIPEVTTPNFIFYRIERRK